MNKKCSRCKKVKDISEFHKKKINKDGHNSICKLCINEYDRERLKHRAEREHIPIKEKRCLKCGKVKDVIEFQKNKFKKDGLAIRCKSCISQDLKECKEGKIKSREKDSYVVITSKKCKFCGKIKNIDCFTINRSTKDGFSHKCKVCGLIYGKKRREKILFLKESSGCKVITEKKCSKCGKIKKVSEFYKNKCSEDNYNAYCKECSSECSRLYRIKNKECISSLKTIYYKKNKEKINLKRKEYQRRNKNRLSLKSKQYYEENKNKVVLQEKHYKNSNAKYKSFYKRLTIDESPRLHKDGESLEVLCKYCGKYFIPLVKSVVSRNRSLNGTSGGDQYLYCSENCKQSCPIFGRVKYPKGFKKQSSREVNSLIRQMCFERDSWECQICGKSTDEVKLHCHHIEGYAQNPRLGNDIDNVVTLCKSCHKYVHTLLGCGLRDLRCKKDNYLY